MYFHLEFRNSKVSGFLTQGSFWIFDSNEMKTSINPLMLQ
jgi:hypothetical protein